MRITFILTCLIGLLAWSSCGNEAATEKKPVLTQIPAPSDWQVIQLGNGFTVAFPDSVSSKIGEGRSIFALDTDEIIYTCEVRDLSDNKDFQKIKDTKTKQFFQHFAEVFGKGYRRDIESIEEFDFNGNKAAQVKFKGGNKTHALAKIVIVEDLVYTAFTSLYVPATEDLMTNASTFVGTLGVE